MRLETAMALDWSRDAIARASDLLERFRADAEAKDSAAQGFVGALISFSRQTSRGRVQYPTLNGFVSQPLSDLLRLISSDACVARVGMRRIGGLPVSGAQRIRVAAQPLGGKLTNNNATDSSGLVTVSRKQYESRRSGDNRRAVDG